MLTRLRHILLPALVLFSALPAAAQVPMPDNVCIGTGRIYWVDSTAYPGSTYRWAIDGTVVQNTTRCAFVHIWNSQGIFTLTVQQFSADGCAGDLQTGQVFVNPLPATSGITGITAPACNGAGFNYSVTLTAGSTYAWTVPAGAIITAGATGPGNNQITVTFGAISGEITVTETNASGCAGSPKALAINLSGCDLVPGFNGSTLTICEGSAVTFTDTSTGTTGGTAYSWNFGPGATPASANSAGPHVVTYSTAGLKTVSLTLTDGASKTVTKAGYITVTPSVTINAFAPATSNRCQGAGLVTYETTANNSTGITYTLDAASLAGGNTINAATGAVTYAAAWSGITTITASAAGCKGPATTGHVVTVNALPGTSEITGNITPPCNSAGYTYSVTLTAGSTYVWTVPADAIITAGSTGPGNNGITVTFGATSGEITVTETTESSCTGSTKTLTISLAGCGLVADFSGSPLTACEGSAVTFTDESAGTTGSTAWSWNFGDGATPATANTVGPHVVTYSTTGLKTVTLTVTDGVSKTEMKTDYISVTPAVTIAAFDPAASVRCQGAGSIAYTTTATNSTGITYTLDAASAAGGNTIDPSTGAVTYVAAWSGTTTITASATGCNGPATATHTVTIHPVVPVSLTISASVNPVCKGNPVTFTAAPVNGGTPSYQWKRNGTDLSGETGPTFTSSILTDQDVITCVMTSSATPCAVGSPAVSNAIILTVKDNATPVFTPIDPLCQNSTAPLLPSSSTNIPPITGTWSPAVISTVVTGTTDYTFTPAAGQCATTATLTVTVNPNVTPTFSVNTAICTGATAPVLPTTSTNGISGSWSPATVSNTATATYTFTPATGQCADTITLTVNVGSSITPTFTVITAICAGETAPILPLTSNEGITGTWTPSTVSSAVTGTYTFTPAAGQCAEPVSMTIVVTSQITPAFAQIGPLCLGSTAPPLPLSSTNTPPITGTWSPATIGTAAASSTTYFFTPAAAQCAAPVSMTIVITSPVTPAFVQIGPLIQNSAAPALQLISLNGITGTWSPDAISTAAVGTNTYTFTPDAGICAESVTMFITVETGTIPTFNPIGPLCLNSTAPDLPLTSLNGIKGTWIPETINTAAAGTTIFTFIPQAGQSAASVIMEITVKAETVPTFTPIGQLCQNDAAPVLPYASLNGITGIWSPGAVTTASAGTTTYTFTPEADQCAALTSIQITILPEGIPVFALIGPLSQNTVAPGLPLTSINGITGTWSPAAINTTLGGTTNYTFTPDPGQCGKSVIIQITIVPEIIPTFEGIGPLCLNSIPPELPQTSLNEINGTWDPAAISTAAAGTITYTFTPYADQGAIQTTLEITVNQPVTPTFSEIGALCQNLLPPALPASSLNDITGTWSPAIISTAAPGIFAYTFTPSAGTCATAKTLAITIDPIPEILITPVSFQCLSDGPVDLSAKPAGGTFSGIGVTGTRFNPATAGIGPHLITYRYTSPAGCSNEAAITISVYPVPTLLITNPAPICIPNTANLTDPAIIAGSSTGLTLTFWLDQAATIRIPDPTAVGEGVYYIKGQASGNCFDIQPVIVTATLPAGIPLFAKGNSSSRAPASETIAYTATSANSTGITYSLDAASIAGGNSINTVTGEVTFVSGWIGTSVITATAEGCNGPKTATHIVTTDYIRTDLFIYADNLTKVYGAPMPILTITYVGLINGDTAPAKIPVINTAATASSPAGTYPITVSGAEDPKYRITYVQGTLTITPASLTITADDQTIVFGAPVPALTFTYSGLVNGDIGTTTIPSVSTTATALSGPGVYPVTVCCASDPNYTITYIQGTLTIRDGKQTPVITWENPADIVYGTPLGALQLNATANVPGSFVYTPGPGNLLCTGAGQTLSVLFTPTDNANYYTATASLKINVLPKPITVTAIAFTKVYDGNTACLGIPVISPDLVTGDTPAFIQTYDNKYAGTGKLLTPTGKVISNCGPDNYTIIFIAVNEGIIEPMKVPVSIAVANKVYDGTTAATLSQTFSGVVNGDNVVFTGGIATFDTPDVGTGKTVTVTGFSLTGPDAGNYQTLVTATTTADITPLPAPAALSVNAASFEHLSDVITMTATISGGAPLGSGGPASGSVTFSFEGNIVKDADNNSNIALSVSGSDLVATLTVSLLQLTPTGSMLSGTKEVVATFNDVSENYVVAPNPAKATFTFYPGFGVIIFPNPADGGDVKFDLTLQVGSLVSIELFSANGQLISKVYSEYLFAGAAKTIVYKHNLPQGIYMYQVIASNQTIKGRIVIIRKY